MRSLILMLLIVWIGPVAAQVVSEPTRPTGCQSNLARERRNGVRRLDRLERRWWILAEAGDASGARDLVAKALRRGFNLYSWTYSDPASWYMEDPSAPGHQMGLWPITDAADTPPLPPVREAGRDQISTLKMAWDSELPRHRRVHADGSWVACARIRWVLDDRRADSTRANVAPNPR